MSEVRVVYEVDMKVIDVEVLVKKEDGKILILAALPVLMPGIWTITWTLKAGAGMTSQPVFADSNGINIIQKPSLLKLVTEPSLTDDGSRLTITFSNECDSANIASYDIRILPNDQSIKGESPTIFVHDPTIAVTSEPIGG